MRKRVQLMTRFIIRRRWKVINAQSWVNSQSKKFIKVKREMGCLGYVRNGTGAVVGGCGMWHCIRISGIFKCVLAFLWAGLSDYLMLNTQLKIAPRLTMAKKKRDKLFFNVLHLSNDKNIAKSMTVLKIFKRSSKWDHAGCCSFIRLEMT